MKTLARTTIRRGAPPPQDHPNAFGARPVLKLMFGALIRAAERWRSVKVTEFECRQMAAVRKELDQEYEAMVDLNAKPSKDAAQVRISSSNRT
jgi:putative transposase